MRGALLLVAMLQVACADIGVSDEPGLDEGLSQSPNGILLNGRYLNGRYLNGVYLNGRYLNGRYLNGLVLGNGLDTVDAVVYRTHLYAQAHPVCENGTLYGPDGEVMEAVTQSMRRCAFYYYWFTDDSIIGSTIDAAIADDGSVWRLRIDDYRVAPQQYATGLVDYATVQKTVEDVYWYTVTYEVNPHEWQPVCGTDASGAPVPAVFLEGRWDYSQGQALSGAHIAEPGAFTLACANTALGKCSSLSYGPWRDDEYPLIDEALDLGQSVPINAPDLHEACTRMIRADYCGDGTPYTEDGTPNDVFDSYGKNSEWAPWWDLDAVWGPDGALCVNYEEDGSGRRSQDPVHCGYRIPDCSTYDGVRNLMNRTDNGVDASDGCAQYPWAPACQP